jgi:K+ transporter
VGLGGASLFFGDAMITPAISVLSAIEGAEVATPLLRPSLHPLVPCSESVPKTEAQLLERVIA